MAPDIKFCGLMRAVDAEQAVAVGAAAIGVVFAAGRRQVTAVKAREIFATTRASRVVRVGVFAGDAPAQIVANAVAAQLDVVQLHDPALLSHAAEIGRGSGARVWAVVGVEGSTLSPVALDMLAACELVLFDSSVHGRSGGTGVPFDWLGARPRTEALRSRVRVGLAGGLTVENVAQAVLAFAPALVDVSSGVERTPGHKDHERMRAFVEAVHATEAQ